MTQYDYILYTDGGCSFNPGGRGGYGVVRIDCSTGEVTEFSGGYQATTNNRMEMTAVIKALETVPEGADVLLVSDSQYVLNCLCGAWKREKNRDLWAILGPMAGKYGLECQWVRGAQRGPMQRTM